MKKLEVDAEEDTQIGFLIASNPNNNHSLDKWFEVFEENKELRRVLEHLYLLKF